MSQIPLFNKTDGDWEQKISLGDQEIIIRIQWNPRSQMWFIDLDDQDGHVVRSRKLCTLWPVCYSHRALFPIVGDFVLMPEVSPAPDYPTFEGLGTTHNLYWLDADELATWEAALGI